MSDVVLPAHAKETVAKALFTHRFDRAHGPWERFIHEHPDLAKIYRENATAALKAVQQLLTESAKRA